MDYTRTCLACAVVGLLLVEHAAAAGQSAVSMKRGTRYQGDATYYGDRVRGFGHCSFHMYGFGGSQGYKGTPLAINAQQYTGTSVCGLCVKYRGVGGGAGGSPVPSAWQDGFVCDQCPECKMGDLDQQRGGDGRWNIEWHPVQCPVGASKFMYGMQASNQYYAKLQVANARVPILSVKIKQGGSWSTLLKTIDNHWEFHGSVSDAWKPCAEVEITSVLGDKVTDKVCCSSGKCSGNKQFPCNPAFPGSC